MAYTAVEIVAPVVPPYLKALGAEEHINWYATPVAIPHPIHEQREFLAWSISTDNVIPLVFLVVVPIVCHSYRGRAVITHRKCYYVRCRLIKYISALVSCLVPLTDYPGRISGAFRVEFHPTSKGDVVVD
jgi:hypothetical protein